MHDARLGKWRLGRLVGRGGAGAVHEGRGPAGEKVAIKLLRPPRTDDERARLERERRLLASLGESEGFVPLLDAGQAEGAWFLVMPFVGGGTLRDRLRRGPLAVDATLDLGRALARALAAAHERGIVHRDLKPENVLFTEDGRALVADLGLAKHFRDDTPGASASVSVSVDGALKGTFGYMPVEQMHDAKSAGPAADVFALGAILHECLAGRPAFHAGSLPELVLAITAHRKEPLARADAPPWFVAAIERALAHDARDRFPDGGAFARALDTAASPASSRRAPLVVGSVVVVLVVAIVATGIVAARAHRERPVTTEEPSPPIAPPEATVGDDVARVGSALDEASTALRAVTRATYLEAKRPTADEERATLATPIDGLEAALDELDSLAPGGALSHKSLSVIARAARRLEDRAARAAASVEVPSVRVLLARAQERALGAAKLDAARRACEELGRRAQPASVDALARYAFAEEDERRASFAGLALARIDDPRASAALVATRRRFGLRSDYWRSVLPAVAPKEAPRDDDAVALCDFAMTCIESGDDARARDALDRAVVLAPSLRPARVLRGAARLHLKDLDGARADLTRAIELDERAPDGWLNRAEVRRDQEDLDGAIADLTRALELDPLLAKAWEFRAATRKDKDEFALAEADATRALELEPRNAKAYRTRGYARMNLANVGGAISDLERFLELAPTHATAPKVRELVAKLRREAGGR